MSPGNEPLLGALAAAATAGLDGGVPMNHTMHTTHKTLVAALLLAVLTSLSPSVQAKPDPAKPASALELTSEERQRLTAARRVAGDKPEVQAAHEQAKADRSAVRKLYLDYKSAREKAASSEAAWRKLMDDALAKADPAAGALAEKEKAAFRARMEASRKSGKPGEKVAAAEDDEDGDEG
jgi:hypothetical protein